MPYFHHDDVDFYYEVHGDGVPLIFSHGLGGESAQVGDLLADLSNVRLILYDNRGHGRTSGIGDLTKLSFSTMADDMGALLNELRIPAAVVGGVSMGVGIAVAFAMRDKERARALILSRPAWLDQPAPSHLAIFPQIANKVDELGCERAQEWLERSDYFRGVKSDFPETAKSLSGLFTNRNAEALSSTLRAIPASTPFVSMEELRAIDMPALVLGNRNDPIHPFAYAQAHAAAIPNARLREIP